MRGWVFQICALKLSESNLLALLSGSERRYDAVQVLSVKLKHALKTTEQRLAEIQVRLSKSKRADCLCIVACLPSKTILCK